MEISTSTGNAFIRSEFSNQSVRELLFVGARNDTIKTFQTATNTQVKSILDIGSSSGDIADGSITEPKLSTGVKTKLNAPADLVSATGNLAGSKISDNSITGTKLANLTIPSSKLGANSVTNSKVSAGIAGSKIANIPESSLSSAVQTKLNASSTPGAQGFQGVFQVRLFTQINSSGTGSLATPPAKPDGNWEWHQSVGALRRKSGASSTDGNYAFWQSQATGITTLNGDIWVVLAQWNPATGQTSAWSDPIATDPDHAQATAGIPGQDGKDGKDGATTFVALTDNLPLNKIPDNLITEPKLNTALAAKVNDKQFKGDLNFNTIYQSEDIFEFKGTQIQVKKGQTFQATATGALTWNDNTWKGLIDQQRGGLRTKLKARSFIDALSGASVSGNNIIFSRENEADLTIAIPSGGGGGASVSTDAQFATGSDTLAPSVNQAKSYADSKDAFLVLWEGQFGNASADNVMTIGDKATVGGLNEYDSTNDRMTITKGGGAGNNTLIEWENPNIDARRVTFLSELSMNTSNWTMSAQIGYTSLAAGDNALEIQQGGWGFLCTRSSVIIGSGAYFGLSVFVGQGGTLGRAVSPREMAQSQVELRGGALAPNGNNPYIRLPYDTTADRVVLHCERIGRLFRIYTDGILRAIISLNDAQAAVPGNSGKFSYAGNPSNTPSIRYYLYKSAVGNTTIRPLSGAVSSSGSRSAHSGGFNFGGLDIAENLSDNDELVLKSSNEIKKITLAQLKTYLGIE